MPNFADLQQKEAESDAGDGSSVWNRTLCDPRSSCRDSDLLLPHSRVKCHEGPVEREPVERLFEEEQAVDVCRCHIEDSGHYPALTILTVPEGEWLAT